MNELKETIIEKFYARIDSDVEDMGHRYDVYKIARTLADLNDLCGSLVRFDILPPLESMEIKSRCKNYLSTKIVVELWEMARKV